MHRQFLEIIKNELDNTDVRDINNAQAFMLCNIGDDELTIGELSLRGYYLGTNVSYTVKKMGMSRLLLKFVQQALLVEQATQPWPSVQGRG